MIEKKYMKSRRMFKITFVVPEDELPPDTEVTSVVVAGSFNGWSLTADALAYTKSAKAWKGSVDLAPGSRAEFRYVANGNRWFNDWDADGYVSVGGGVDNCVVVVPSA
jgi:hypothetical protein